MISAEIMRRDLERDVTPSSREKAEAHLAALLAVFDAPRHYDEQSFTFMLNNPHTPEKDQVHKELADLLGFELPELPGPETNYETKIPVRVMPNNRGRIMCQIINVGGEYPEYQPGAVWVTYTAESQAQTIATAHYAGSLGVQSQL